MNHPRLLAPFAFAVVALTLTAAPELRAQNSDLPKLPGQASGASSSGSTDAAQPPAPAAAPTTPVVAGPTLPAPADTASPASTPAPAAASAPTVIAPKAAAAPKAGAPKIAATKPANQKFEYWTASKTTVRVYPQPSARSSFMHDEHYVIEQSIKVLDTVPGGKTLPWLKVLTPSNKIGYVFSGEARPANVSKSGKPMQSVNNDD